MYPFFLLDEMSVENFIYQSQERALEGRLQDSDPNNYRRTNQHQTTALLQDRNETPYQNHFTSNLSNNQGYL